MIDKETLGVILGWIVVTVTAWFVALALLGYIGGDIFPWHWTSTQRALHLILQFLLIGLYAIWARPGRGRR